MGARAGWPARKIEFSSPGVLLRPAVPVYFIHSVVTSGVRQPPHVLHRRWGGPNLKMFSPRTHATGSALTHSDG